MERNETGNDGATPDNGATGTSGDQSGANEFSGAGAPRDENFDFSDASSGSEQSQSLKDRARGAIGTAGGRLADVGSTVRDRAGAARDKIADALESGADRLRHRASVDAALAGATAAGSTPITGEGRVAHISDRVAGGMERSAEWLRDADLDNLKSSVEQQVKEHPARTLLIAAGLGYLIGRAFRSGNQ
jgi:ElaB/YqjD/DUF883 family membrane-anchored ribosome-binding protein